MSKALDDLISNFRTVFQENYRIPLRALHEYIFFGSCIVFLELYLGIRSCSVGGGMIYYSFVFYLFETCCLGMLHDNLV